MYSGSLIYTFSTSSNSTCMNFPKLQSAVGALEDKFVLVSCRNKKPLTLFYWSSIENNLVMLLRIEFETSLLVVIPFDVIPRNPQIYFYN